MKFSYRYFIPKSFEKQPFSYRSYGGNIWAAEFRFKDGSEYQIELDRWNMFSDEVRQIKLCKQEPSCRKVIFSGNTLKSVLEKFSSIIKAQETQQ